VDFFGINGWEFLVLILLAMFIFGPDKLPKAIADGVKMLRNLRDMARNATSDLSRELGTDIQLEDLHPKALIRKHILSEDDERAIRQPIEELVRDVRKDVTGVRGDLHKVARDADPRRAPLGRSSSSTPSASAAATTAAAVAPAAAPPPPATPYDFDEDAT
jgi:sec-independent protein translocase protein TatB